jgi:hypothetical protein
MTTQERIDEAMRAVGKSFEDDEAALNRLRNTITKYPKVTLQDAWDALPMLFWLGILDADQLSSMPYSEFLQTPYWIAVSDHVKTRRPWCALCCEPFAGPLEVHHRTYKHRGDEWRHLDDLTVLCRECHEWISQKGRGK